ncbi:metallophosphoesterase [Clostridium sp. BJN0001]|uniref:metallophosphoesterase n=1 Tax=Clostridium sp. BJN0001 TaxID=2930219 RepID=UPI001FD24B23|nr:metallophosphoesterase [Clostridium sp. BJN0001]
MLIAVVSDTHRNQNYINKAKEIIIKKNTDILIHLGDNIEDFNIMNNGFKGEGYCVSGNCDFSSIYPKEDVLEINGKKIFFTHGDIYGVKRGLDSIYIKAKSIKADIVLFGHTHEPLKKEINNILLLNPGSISLPKSIERYIIFLNISEDGNIETVFNRVKL